MSIYRYTAPSAIDEITFVKSENGGIRAYLQAGPGATREQLRKVVTSINDKNHQAIPYMVDEKPTLEVRGFDSERALLRQLEKDGVIIGKPAIDKGESHKLSAMEQVRKRSLQLAGAFYLLGDIGFISYGFKESHPENMVAGLAYFGGTLALLGYGRNDQSDIQIHDLAQSMEQFLEKEHGKIPETCSLHAIARDKDKGLIQNANDMARRYPSEIFNSFTGLAGIFMAVAAAKYHVLGKPAAGADAQAIRKMRQEGWLDVGLGAMTTGSAAISMFVTEKKRDPDEPKAKGMEGIWEWVQEKPLRVAGYGYMVSTMCHAASTAIAYREAKRTGDAKRLSSVPMRALFVGAALISELLVAISSKGHGEGITSDESVKHSIYAMAAELIVKEPPDQRDWHIQHVAGFLQQPNVLAEAFEDVEKELRTQVALLEKNPWACCTYNAQQEQKAATPQAPPTPAEIPQHPAHNGHGAHAHTIPGTMMQPASIAGHNMHAAPSL